MSQVIILHKPEVSTEAKIPRVREEFCIGCGVCVKVCPVAGVIKLDEEEILSGVVATKVGMPASAEEIKVAIGPFETCPLPDYCIKCRRCVDECPTGARVF